MSYDIHPRKVLGISKRAWHRIEVESKRRDTPTPSRRKQRRKPMRIASPLFAVGREYDCGDVLLTRAKRRPADYWAENIHGVKCLLRKHGKGQPRGWSVLLPEGGKAIPFRIKRAAINFIARVAPVDEYVTPDEAVVDPEHHADLSRAADRAPFSHNDVDEDGCIIDIDVNGNSMEYGR